MKPSRQSAVRAELRINPFSGTSSLRFFDRDDQCVDNLTFWDDKLEEAWSTAEQSINECMTSVTIFDPGKKMVVGNPVTFGAKQFENHRRARQTKLPWQV